MSYDETVQTFSTFQTDVGDFISTLKHYKLEIPSEFTGSSYQLNFEQIRRFLLHTDFRAVVSTNSKLKQKESSRKFRFCQYEKGGTDCFRFLQVVKSILERVQDSLVPSMNHIVAENQRLSTLSNAGIAGAVVGLQALTDKLNPVIKPLMESVKKEPLPLMQRCEELMRVDGKSSGCSLKSFDQHMVTRMYLFSLSARKLAKVLEFCVERGFTAPAEKVVKNLVAFSSADSNTTPTHNPDPNNVINTSIWTLKYREVSASLIARSSGPRVPSKRGRAADTIADCAQIDNGRARSEGDDAILIQTRGAKLGLETIISHFHDKIFQKLPTVRRP